MSKSLTERQLEILFALDRIRDTTPAPEAMFSAILGLLAEQFDIALCLLYLSNRETGQLELKAVHQRGAALGLEASRLQPLAQQAMRVEGVSVWRGDQVPVQGGWVSDAPADLQVTAIPVVMETAPLGVVLLARAGRPFDADEIQLLKTAESQVDSAVLQAYVYRELQQRNKELETVYRVDRIRDQNLPFDDMLDSVLQELCAAIGAAAGVVLLYDHAGHQLTMRAVTPKDFLSIPTYEALIDQAANEALDSTEMVVRSAGTGGVPCTVMCVPLILRNEIIGVLGAVSTSPQGFTSDEKRLLRAIVSQMDTAIFEGLERSRLRRVLGRSLDPHVMNRLLENPNVDILKGERLLATVLYADLRGSTSLAERSNPDVLVEFINAYLGQMANIVLRHEGTLDKFVGDEVMALFGAPFPQADHALRAARVGLAMQAGFAELLEQWSARNIGPVGLGVGMATGELTAGEFGCERRTDYTVIGRAANLGARICGSAHAGQVLVSQSTYDLIKAQVEATPVPGQHFKGIDQKVTVYNVTRVLE